MIQLNEKINIPSMLIMAFIGFFAAVIFIFVALFTAQTELGVKLSFLSIIFLPLGLGYVGVKRNKEEYKNDFKIEHKKNLDIFWNSYYGGISACFIGKFLK